MGKVAPFFLAKAVLSSIESVLAIKKVMSNALISLSLSRSDLHSMVQPLVKAFGKKANTTY